MYMLKVEMRDTVLTHAPMISLGSKQTVDEDDRSTLSRLALLRLIQIVCHSHAITQLGG